MKSLSGDKALSPTVSVTEVTLPGYLQYTRSSALQLTAFWESAFLAVHVYSPWALGWMSSSFKSSHAPQPWTWEAPWKLQDRFWAGNDWLEQFMDTLEPLYTTCVPLGSRRDTGLTTAVTFRGPPRKYREVTDSEAPSAHAFAIHPSIKHSTGTLSVAVS